MIKLTNPEVVDNEVHFSIENYDNLFLWKVIISSGTIELNQDGSVYAFNILEEECEIVITKSSSDSYEEISLLVEMV